MSLCSCSYVSFVVLVNGQSNSFFYPSRGRHQGDPLSPYLFLFCAEALSALIRSSVESGVLHGIHICRGDPKVSMLFFADNTIIFRRANEMELGRVKRVLDIYEEASGQAINLNKFEIMFSRGISMARGDMLADLLEVKKVEQRVIYFGIPTNVGRSRSAIFRSLIDRVEKIFERLEEQYSFASREAHLD